ncbi:receptor-like protein 6 [Solanum dulcamara]|uniref:receptor-like protein 6 n=1 Tax=Solanum dulcamara TaxID=45834 RepID=UPI00248621CE|nr:receptor-like protein 6 [Solanum dulcamara]
MVRLFFFYSLVCFVLLSQSFSSSSVHHLCSPSEAFALIQFKQTFEIISDEYSSFEFTCFPKTVSWNESTDCCTWDGVTCDMLTGHVIDLDLSCSLLNGSIHPNSSLFQLYHLQTLNLAQNNFNYSSIPNDIGRLRNLRNLNLSESHFDDNIPTEISYLSNLVSLDLSGNRCELDQKTFETLLQNFTNLEVVSLSFVNISSPIPMNLSSSLRYVDLQSTNLQGVLTENFFLLPNLERLKLDYNKLLKGDLPKLHPSNTLLELSIANTGISGELPYSIGTLNSLNHLNLHGCDFSGGIPDSIGNLTQFRQLDLGDNHFTGHIPSTISKLKKLTHLDLSSNSFGGEILNVFSNLQELAELYLSNNSFIGPFPSSILNLTYLQSLDLSSNSLSGPLPSNASKLPKLFNLNLSHNSLNGTIPSWVFNIPSLGLHHNQFSRVSDELKTNQALEFLDLSHNQLTGPFPQSLANLINLIFLDLSSNNITGDAGVEVFATMQSLDSLYLSYNPLSWRININVSKITFPSVSFLLLSSCELEDFPHFLRNLKNLQILDLSNNKIHGPVPNWFSGMKWDYLLCLNLSYNSLTGHIDQLPYHGLPYLDVKFNFLQGPLPSSICNSSLLMLDLSHNYFNDSIPSCLGSMAELKVLDLRENNFSGNLPPLCSRSTSLTTIVLNGNHFEGPVPVSLLNCTGLEVLDLGTNAITDTFPAWLGTLQHLEVLILKSNKFHGPISSCQTKFCFPKLRIFDISHNEFSGSLSAEVFENFRAMTRLNGADEGEIKYMKHDIFSELNIIYEDSVRLVIKGNYIELERINTIMTAIDLSVNHFEGVIPKALMDLGSLWLLNLSHNNLKGDIPMEMGQLKMLEALDLSWNQLTGKIPQELIRLTFLEMLNLSQNVLVGPIPQGLQFNTFENDSYGGNLDLCGPPLSKKCGTSDPSHVPQPLESEEECDSYFFSGFTWESVVIGYSFGLVVGTIVWSLMLKALDRNDLHNHSLAILINVGFLKNSAFFKDPTQCDIQLDQKTFETLLQNFTNLEVVSLSNVNISSPIPMNLSSSVRYVDLINTNLRGVPTESFCVVPNLEMLKLGYNHLLKGVLPKIHLSSTLLELRIARTGISGELPDSILTLNSLNRLDLYGCQFSGSIPDSVGNLTQIRELDFSENNFTSHIPSTSLTMLEYKSLRL